jgi:hypothetical protein
MTDPLEAMLAMAESHARRVLVGTEDDLLPLFHLDNAKGESIVVATPFTGDTAKEVIQAKNMVADAVRELIKLHDVVRYSFLSEAWMTIRPLGWKEGMGPPPVDSDDRIEVVIVLATDGVAHRHRRWKIKREGAKCVDLILDVEADDEWTGGGRFDNLLPQGTRQ